MGVLFDGDISGSGVETFTGAGVLFYTVDVTTIGGIARVADDDDHIIRAGWISLGDTLDVGLGTFDYWRNPEYIDFTHTLWTPLPSSDGSGVPLQVFASRVRWFLSLGAEAHLHVYGA